jgi:uncharacterized oxidoreductase
MPVFKAEQLRQMGLAIFQGAGASEGEAKRVVELLVESNLIGHDSHGVIRISGYVTQILSGKMNLGVEAKVVRESATTALVDGGWGLGQIVATQTMNLAIEKARDANVSVISTFNCQHVGRMADYAIMAVEQDMIGFCCVNSRPGVVPFGGMQRMFNQSPLGWAIPAGEEKPFVLDISTSVCAGGKIAVARARGMKLPPGYIIDKNGKPSVDPEDYYRGGAGLPLGGPVGYKGFGLAMVVDITAGLLSGRGASHVGGERGQGVFQMAINIDAFRPIKEFKKEMDELIRAVKGSKTAPGFNEILIPGELERRTKREKQITGIYLSSRTWDELVQTGKKVNVNLSQYV